MNNKKLTITLIANIMVFLINSLIGFFMTPYIVNYVGAEAYGFVSLANSFTNYANTLMLALNSMAGRFITIEIHQKNIDQANKYFTSVLVANLIMTVVLFVPAIFCIIFAEKLINISPQLVGDVKILFGFIFIAFFFNLMGTAFSCSTYASNRKDLEAKRQIESYFIKVAVLIGCFSLLSPHIYYVGISMCLMSIYVFVANVRYTKTLTPMLKVKTDCYDKKSIKTLLQSGIWNSIQHLSTTLFTGLDVLIANIFLSGTAMGVLSVAKLLPGMVEMLIWQTSSVFVPEYTIAYAKSDRKRFLQSLRKTIIVASIISNVCMCVLCVISKDFYKLWIPAEDAKLLSVLSVLTISSIFVCAGIYCMYNIAIVTDKIKIPAIVKTGFGVLNIILMPILLKFTNLGLYAIAGTSAFLNALFNLIFYVPYAAHCIKEKASIFYKPVAVNVLALLGTVIIGFWLKSFFKLSGWLELILFAILLAIISLVTNIIFCTSLEEKKQAITFIKHKLKR